VHIYVPFLTILQSAQFRLSRKIDQYLTSKKENLNTSFLCNHPRDLP